MANIENLKPFKKGHDPRRNTKGRPESAFRIKKKLDDEAMKVVVVGGEPMTMEDLILKRVYKAAAEGNLEAIKMIWERREGKVATADQVQRWEKAEAEADKALAPEEMGRLSKLLGIDLSDTE